MVFAASVFAVICTTLLYAFPLAGLILKVGQQVVVPTNAGGRAFVHWSPQQAAELILHAPAEFSAEYAWTFVLGISTAVCCVPVAWLIAAATRPHRRWQVTVDLISLLMVLIPGPLVGLAVIWLFQRPIPGFHSLYHHTIVPTVAALSVRALPISYWIMRAGYAGIDQSVLDVARLEASWPRRMLSVDRTLLARPLTITFFAAALVSSGDVPATLPVIPPEVVTVGTRLFSLLHSGVRNQESALAFWYVVGVVTIAVSLSLHWKRRPR